MTAPLHGPTPYKKDPSGTNGAKTGAGFVALSALTEFGVPMPEEWRPYVIFGLGVIAILVHIVLTRLEAWSPESVAALRDGYHELVQSLDMEQPEPVTDIDTREIP